MAETDPVRTLILLFAVVWVLVLVGVILIFKVIVPFNPFPSFFLNSLLKGIFSGILGLAWLYMFAELRNMVMKKELSLTRPNASEQKVD